MQLTAIALSLNWVLQDAARAKLLGRLSGAVLIGGGIWLSLVVRSA